VNGAVGVVFQAVDRLPYGHVKEDAVVLGIGAKVRGIAGLGLQAPDEAGAGFGESVELVETVHEAGHLRVLDWHADAAEVDLGDVVASREHVTNVPGMARTSASSVRGSIREIASTIK